MERTVRTQKEVLAKLTQAQREAVKRRVSELEKKETSPRRRRKPLTPVRIDKA